MGATKGGSSGAFGTGTGCSGSYFFVLIRGRPDWPPRLLLCKSRLSTLVSDFVTVKLWSSISQKFVSSFSPSVVITATEHRRSYSIVWTPSLRNRCIVKTPASTATWMSFVPFCNIELSELGCSECFCSALYSGLGCAYRGHVYTSNNQVCSARTWSK